MEAAEEAYEASHQASISPPLGLVELGHNTELVNIKYPESVHNMTFYA